MYVQICAKLYTKNHNLLWAFKKFLFQYFTIADCILNFFFNSWHWNGKFHKEGDVIAGQRWSNQGAKKNKTVLKLILGIKLNDQTTWDCKKVKSIFSSLVFTFWAGNEINETRLFENKLSTDKTALTVTKSIHSISHLMQITLKKSKSCFY